MILRVILAIVLLGIGYLSLTPRETLTIGNDKVSHLIAYAVLMVIMGLTYFDRKSLFIRSILFAVFYGIVLELIQQFIPGRDTSIFDILANIAGVLLGVIFVLVIYKPLLPFLKSLGIK